MNFPRIIMFHDFVEFYIDIIFHYIIGFEYKHVIFDATE